MSRRGGGRHAAPRARRRPVGPRARLLDASLSLLLVLGASLVATSWTSAVGPGTDVPVTDRAPQATTALALRAARVSRDSSRQALEDRTGRLTAPGTAQAREENAEIAKLVASAEKIAAKLARNSWQLPIQRGQYRLTARFGQCSGLWAHCHTGLDFAAPSGTPVLAVANGVVSDTGWAGAYGNRMVVTLEDGTEIWYCHLSAYEAREGDTVIGGATVARVGSTGNSTGPHLHVEVRPGGGDAVDPYEAFSVRGQEP